MPTPTRLSSGAGEVEAANGLNAAAAVEADRKRRCAALALADRSELICFTEKAVKLTSSASSLPAVVAARLGVRDFFAGF
ncbi:MAG: hypothetical protein H0T80_02250 [Betaproteobacteria bacterium]|nr:hypothetical protein [Betaproteobacteria bacterium]